MCTMHVSMGSVPSKAGTTVHLAHSCWKISGVEGGKTSIQEVCRVGGGNGTQEPAEEHQRGAFEAWPGKKNIQERSFE